MKLKRVLFVPAAPLLILTLLETALLGSRVNFEVGSVTANHYNERIDKNIVVIYNSEKRNTNVTKFGSLVGDDSKTGANAVLSPGALLMPKSIIKRFELVEQLI